MKRLQNIAAILSVLPLLSAAVGRAQDKAEAETTYEVVVYGGTAGGVVAAVQAAKMGKSVVLIEPGKHLGGLSSGGLGATDIGNKGAIGGLSREFYRRVSLHYAKPEAWKFQKPETYRGYHARAGNDDAMWTFEPHVAEAIFREMLNEAKVPVVESQRLNLKTGVKKEGARIVSLTMESGRAFRGKMFIDATYEGDVMALAGVAYHVGRESNETYKETLNGVQLGLKQHQFKVPVDPYVKPGDPSSGLLPGVHGEGPGAQGQGDKRVQAYNFRMCLTDAPENRVPFPKPEGYDPLRYELLLRYIQAGVWDAFNSNSGMPNRKTDTNNNGGFSTDNIGMNYDYPDGDYAVRARIFQDHVTYQLGMMWFLANDPRVPEKIRDQMNRWGLTKDEFPESGGWPHQMYVREARRMISDTVMTQHHCQGRTVAEDPVGMAAYTMDSHNTQRFVKDGHAINEGDVQVGGFAPYPISYRSLVPKQSECENLLVPVCLAASHIAYGSIRMEPVFMVLGQSAATAACQALENGVAVQKIDYPKLRERLLADRQVLVWAGGGGAGLDLKTLPGIVVDDAQAERTGEWLGSASIGGFVGAGYLHDNNEGKGQKQIRFKLPIKNPGKYEVRIWYTSNPNRATNVPVVIRCADGREERKLNQRQKPSGDGFTAVGTFSFGVGAESFVDISNQDTDGHVVIDAVQLLPK